MPKDEFVDEDPMELVGMVMPGEAGQLERMAETIVEEYARMGWDERRMMTLFTHSMFMATYRIYQLKGEAYVKDLLARTCAKYRIVTAEVDHA
jgi:hypothetical protein